MKKFGMWLLKLLTSALCICLVIVMLPYLSAFLHDVMPDLSGRAVNTSITIFHEMNGSARLETNQVHDEGIISSTVNAAFVGDLSSLTIKYTYTASLGIDLTKVQMSVRGNKITLYLPAIEVLNDGIMEEDVARNDWWYNYSDSQRMKLLQQERQRCREKALNEYANSEEAWQNTLDAFEKTFGAWLDKKGIDVTVKRLVSR